MKRENYIRNFLAAAFIAGLIFQQAITVNAAFGDLDTSFSGDGIYLDTPTGATPRSIARQADGKILVVGYTFDDDVDRYVLLLRRYNANGSVDTGFGWSGSAIPYNVYGQAERVFVQTDGKIVVVGSTSSPSEAGAIWRFNSNGTHDSSFGASGRKILGSIPLIDVAGYKPTRTSPQDLIVLSAYKIYRLYPNGNLNTLFGTAGVIDVPIPAYDEASEITVRQSSIYVVNRQTANAAIIKFTISGQLDPGFGNQGVFEQSVSGTYGCQIPPNQTFGTEGYNTLGFQSDGKIVTGGSIKTYDISPPVIIDYYTALLIRHQPNGDFDFSFKDPCDSELTGTSFTYAEVKALKILADDKILFAINGIGKIFRVTIDGYTDDDFYTAGNPVDFLVQPDGKIVIVGQVEWSGAYRIRLSRHLP